MLRSLLISLILLVGSARSSRLKYRASVKENVELYHTVTTLETLLAANYQQTIEFLNSNSPYTTYFLVDGQKLRTSRLIDREEFCRIKLCEHSLCHPCEIEMDFVLKENGQPRDILSLVLTVEDENEFRPQFVDVSATGQVIQLNISEGVPVGHVLPIPSATDKDGEDDDLVYWLEKTAKIPFELVSFGSNQIALNVTEPLDRETRDFYELKLTACDRGNLTSTIPIQISISDINDNVPFFDQPTLYNITVSESTPPSLTKALLRIHAVDNDSNDNGQVTYNFSPQVSELIRQTFQLDPNTGELFLLQALDYEQYKDYRIQVTAQDSGPVSVPVYTVILVNVADENDNAPIMNVRVSEYFHLINNTLYISERTSVNTLLMHIIVQDFDANENGRVTCSIEPAEPKLNLTNTLNNMFAVYTAQAFDREQHANYSIRIVLKDNGRDNQHRTVRELALVITDINDNPPVFSRPSYNVSVEEETDYEQAIVQVQASDADINENGEVSYELLSREYEHLFRVEPNSGEVFVIKKLNREFQSDYNLTIRARDHGTYPSHLSTDVCLYVHVLDINEFAPEFEQKKYTFANVDESLAVGAPVGFVKAVDRDDQPIHYSMTSADLLIDQLTGEIFVRKQLDYDTNPCINAIITAKDQGNLSSTAHVEVCLKPINEFSPELHPSSRLVHVNIDNTSVVQLNASDRDRSPSGFLSFHYGPPSTCNATFSRLLSNGTIVLNTKEPCAGIVDVPVMLSDNDQYPAAKRTNATVRFVFYSKSKPLTNVASNSFVSKLSYNTLQNLSFHTLTLEMIIAFVVVITLVSCSAVLCLVACIVCRKRRVTKRQGTPGKLLVKQSPSPIMNSSQKRLTLLTSASRTSKDRICYTESHCLLSDGSPTNGNYRRSSAVTGRSPIAALDMNGNSPYSKLQQSIKTAGTSDTGSSYNDSCYGSSEMDVCHHHHHHQSAGNKSGRADATGAPAAATAAEATGKILLSSNENYIILCQDSSTNSDETNPSTPISSSSSSSPTANNNSLITTCQPSRRPGKTQQFRTQLKSTVDQSNKKMEFFQNDDEYRKVLGSTTSFNCRNLTPMNEYYL